MNDTIKVALIAGLVSVICAGIAASVQWTRYLNDQREKADPENVPDKPIVADDKGLSRTLYARVLYKDSDKTISAQDPTTGGVKADVCVLTTVSSYGGASKTCSLSHKDEGWVLTATARKATATCGAVCFDVSRHAALGNQ